MIYKMNCRNTVKKIIIICVFFSCCGNVHAQLFKKLKDKANLAVQKATNKIVDKAEKVPEKVVEHPIEKVQQKVENKIDNTQNKTNNKTDNAIDKTDNIKLKKKKRNTKSEPVTKDSVQVEKLKKDSTSHQ